MKSDFIQGENLNCQAFSPAAVFARWNDRAVLYVAIPNTTRANAHLPSRALEAFFKSRSNSANPQLRSVLFVAQVSE
jgi:hypothetical protein